MASRRRGFTLVEALLAFVIGALVVALLWQVLRACLGLGRRADASLQGTSDAASFAERFQQDLRHLYWDAQHDLSIEEGGAKVSFWRFDDEASVPEQGQIRVQPVSWRFDPAAGTLLRSGADGAWKALHGRYDKLTVSLDEVGEASGAGRAAVLRWTLSAQPDRGPVPGPGAVNAPLRTVLSGSASLVRKNSERQNPFWQPSPNARAQD